jgi:hypothetical protein
MVDLLFLPSVYIPCPTCHGTRYNPKTLEIRYRGKNIAEVLAMTVNAARDFFDDQPHVRHSLSVLQEVGLGYLRLGSLRRNFQEAKRRESNWPPNCNVRAEERHSTFSMSQPPACMLLTLRNWLRN